MKSISYDIDPGSDIELILKKPNKQNIVPEDTPGSARGKPSHLDCPNPPCLGRYQVFSELYPDGENETPDVEVHMRVSSRHLILASRIFRAMLEGPWKEGNSSYRSIRQISAEDWDAFALATVMDSIHGRHYGMPTVITLGLLARITTIVDYYQCQEAMHFNFKAWAPRGAEPLWWPTEALLWVYVSWVFHDDRVFQRAAHSILLYGNGKSRYTTYELPVSGLLTKLDDIRQTMIKKALEALDFLQEQLTEEEGCEKREDPDCTAIILGTLIREKRLLARHNPPLVAPFDGNSLDDVLGLIREFSHPMIPHSNNHYVNPSDNEDHPCTIMGRLKPTLDEIDRAVQSIRLADFKPKYTRHENF